MAEPLKGCAANRLGQQRKVRCLITRSVQRIRVSSERSEVRSIFVSQRLIAKHRQHRFHPVFDRILLVLRDNSEHSRLRIVRRARFSQDELCTDNRCRHVKENEMKVEVGVLLSAVTCVL